MNLSAPFVRRPIGTALLTIGLALAGIASYFNLPISPLPQIDIPTISVSASLPGASPDTMAASVATPLERRLGRIADVSEMTSSSSTGSSQIVLQFGFDRDINGAARDVQAAINASRADLPSTLRANPTYRKVNPSAAPILILALTSPTRSPAQIYDAAANIIQQQLSQVSGVGEVEIGGASLPAVRVELNPAALAARGISSEDVRAALASANANRPKGIIESEARRFQIYTNDQGSHAADYRNLVIAWRNNAPVRLSDVADVVDGVEDLHNIGLFNGKPSIVVLITQEPGANIIATVDRIKALLPTLNASLPHDIAVELAGDRSTTIRASLSDVELTLVAAIALVVIVTLLFLKSFRATAIPAIAVAVSLLGSLGVMVLAGFSLDNLSLMALTIATGFVVDDAIVVLENTTRHLEHGMARFDAALFGAREVGFTVLSISVSLVAVFIPILFMNGLVGRLFREFALTLTAAIFLSLVISLTTTPMMCAYLLPRAPLDNRWTRLSDKIFARLQRGYERILDWSLAAQPVTIALLLCAIVLSAYLYAIAPKGFFPQQDTGQISGAMRVDQSTSFAIASNRLTRFVAIIGRDPAVQTVVGFTGGSGRGAGGGGFVNIALKPRDQRHVSSADVITRLAKQFNRVSGANLFLTPVQDIRAGGRQSNAAYQYTLTADNRETLRLWAEKLTDAMAAQPELTQVNSDQTDHGLQVFVNVDRDAAAKFGISTTDVDSALYDNFGQRDATTIYNAQNQYHVVMEASPAYGADPGALTGIYVPGGSVSAASRAPQLAGGAASVVNAPTASLSGAPAPGAPSAASGPLGLLGGASVAGASLTGASLTGASLAGAPLAGAPLAGAPLAGAPPDRNASQGDALAAQTRRLTPLSAIATWTLEGQPRSVNHQDLGVATTISFDLARGKSLSDASQAIERAQAQIAMPASVQGSFQGTARVFQQSLSNEPLLILIAIVAVYMVLGILYESVIHPITVLSTLPSAGLGAVTALIVFHTEFSLIALIGVFLLIGIVKKNAILIIDFALEAERARGLTPLEAIREASLIRFRPILMTTMAAIFAALPLAIGWGEGSELRRPLGIAVIGGLFVSQALTLITSPTIYLLLDRFRRRSSNESTLGRSAFAREEPA